jgi:hypothetical protein
MELNTLTPDMPDVLMEMGERMQLLYAVGVFT